uniref:Uncharacterized protein n=1 Tax=Anguilla anguilla TaxID=7936 RepID=A0A0E9WEI6_ANGAN
MRLLSWLRITSIIYQFLAFFKKYRASHTILSHLGGEYILPFICEATTNLCHCEILV